MFYLSSLFSHVGPIPCYHHGGSLESPEIASQGGLLDHSVLHLPLLAWIPHGGLHERYKLVRSEILQTKATGKDFLIPDGHVDIVGARGDGHTSLLANRQRLGEAVNAHQLGRAEGYHLIPRITHNHLSRLGIAKIQKPVDHEFVGDKNTTHRFGRRGERHAILYSHLTEWYAPEPRVVVRVADN